MHSEKFSVWRTFEIESALTLTLLESDVSGEVSHVFRGYNLKKKMAAMLSGRLY